MLALALLAVLPTLRSPQEAEVRAQWRCEPESIAVGEPFELVLELAHPAGISGRELSSGDLALDESWVVLDGEKTESAAAGDGTLRTRRTWRVASLEPGERVLSDALSRVVLSERVTQIQVGGAKVSVAGVLAEGEDEPRPLREFPDGFAGVDAEAGRSPWLWLWLGLAGLVLAGGLAGLVWRRRRTRRGAARATTPLERLAELERAGGDDGCFELTRLLRQAGDDLRRTRRGGLTDEEWLAEVTASLDVPRTAASELAAVFERTARVKYAGEAPTPWAMQETFARARAALEVLGAGTGGTRP